MVGDEKMTEWILTVERSAVGAINCLVSHRPTDPIFGPYQNGSQARYNEGLLVIIHAIYIQASLIRTQKIPSIYIVGTMEVSVL